MSDNNDGRWRNVGAARLARGTVLVSVVTHENHGSISRTQDTFNYKVFIFHREIQQK